MEQQAIITVKDLRTYFYSDKRCNKVLNGISFELYKGRTLCVVGESGCGKSVTATSVMQLLPKLSRIESGSITYHSDKGDIRIDQLPRNGKQMRALRGRDMAMIFQDPMTALNPVIPVGKQISEVIRKHQKCSRTEATARAGEMLNKVGIAPERASDYPHQFSGGMKQRVVIAMALACNPKLLLADEPTTALDVTIQAQMLEMIKELQREFHTAMILITHDLGIVAETCDSVAIMYAGELVEYGTAEHIFEDPLHPYTVGLFEAIPSIDEKTDRLKAIPGLMPDPADLPKGCKFAPRCPYSTEECRADIPPYRQVEPGHFVRCNRCKAQEEVTK